MPALWSRSRTLGAKKKIFSWRLDSHGNIFIKRKFRKNRLPRIDKISCSHLDRLCLYMQNTKWNHLANRAVKLYMGTEKEGIGKFLYRLRPDVSYAQLSSQLRAIFYISGVWEWNEQKRGMKFLLLSESWQEKTTKYYRISLDIESEDNSPENFSKYAGIKGQKHEIQGKTILKNGQMTLYSFFNF
jgi:hypothetical protein